MKRRKFDSKTKTMIVLQGLRGKAVSEICAQHQISQLEDRLRRENFGKDLRPR